LSTRWMHSLEMWVSYGIRPLLQVRMLVIFPITYPGRGGDGPSAKDDAIGPIDSDDTACKLQCLCHPFSLRPPLPFLIPLLRMVPCCESVCTRRTR